MCAIAGCIHLPMKQETIRAMLSTMARRGPDGQGCYQEGQCTLLHTRLAIIDPQGGKQPMSLEYGGDTESARIINRPRAIRIMRG